MLFNDWNGIYLHFSKNNTIISNIAYLNNESGISVDASTNTLIVNNIQTRTIAMVYVYPSL